MLLRHGPRAGTRRGVILMVVLALLTLFAILGLSFVMYSDAEANSARIFRESQNLAPDPTDVTAAWKAFLGQLIYDANDDSTGAASALRGHSLGRTMYGWNDTAGVLNDKAYCGTGRLNETLPARVYSTLTGQQAVNYMYFQTDKLVRDPGRRGTRAAATAAALNTLTNRGQIVGDLNVPYTYPDANNMFLAMIDPTSGTVKVPSYHRSWVFNPTTPTADLQATNANWTNASGKYTILRPRTVDMDPTFPPPADGNGDVKNLDWAPGGNDSIWIDMGYPVQTAPDGTQIKVLVAPLVLDMDGRINVNTAGNIMASVPKGNPQPPQGQGKSHASNQGWGPWEVNLSSVLSVDAVEWLNLFNGLNTTAGKYGLTTNPPPKFAVPVGVAVPGGTPVHAYYPMDYNAVVDKVAPGAFPRYPLATTAQSWNVPGSGGVPAYQTFPTYPAIAYGNVNPVETTNHASIYNPMRAGSPNVNFGAADLAAILRRFNYDGNTVPSNLLTLLPQNLVGTSTQYNDATYDPNAALRRGRITTLSFDLDRPGVTPYIWNRNNPAYTYTQWDATNPTTPVQGYTTGSPISGPLNAGRGVTAATQPVLRNPPSVPPADSEYDATTWKSVLAGLGRINLGRTLTNYPALGTNPGLPNQFDPGNAQFQLAVSDRQALAADIFKVLWSVTGAANPAPAAPAAPPATGSAKYNALQWLAQLAVNIVDFIDVDDYMTPFNWLPSNPKAWVFGTELPRVVINEYYAQWDNNPASVQSTGKPKVTKVAGRNPQNRVNMWVELYNPFPADAAAAAVDPQKGTALLYNGPAQGNAAKPYAIYQLIVSHTPDTANIRLPSNTIGTPDVNPPTAGSVVNNWGNTAATTTIQPGFNQYSGTPGQNLNGFYVVGPPANYTGFVAPANPNLPKATYTTAAMSYTLAYGAVQSATDPSQASNAPSLVLQRLANPYLPPNNAPGATYNPYITVDYVSQAYVQNCLLYDTNGAIKPAPSVANLTAYGRQQPYAAFCLPMSPGMKPIAIKPGFSNPVNQWVAQKPAAVVPAPKPAPPTQPQHTFFRHNGIENAPPNTQSPNTITIPFDVPFHPNRPLVSIADLLHVSGWRPHEFTQQFVDPSGVRLGHRTRWTDQTTNLLRAWEFLTIGPRSNGPAFGGRIPGKININTVWDQTIFTALCDDQPANLFNGQSSKIWTPLIKARDGGSGGTPGQNSTPFWGLATGTANGGDLISTSARGVNNTLLASNTTGNTTWDASQLRLMEPINDTAQPPFGGGTFTQPLQRFELLSKIMGNLTTRSNVFGVWATFGFFTVTNNATTPVKLGAEYVWPNLNTTQRHKMFAIVDRTQLQVWPTYVPGTANTPTVTTAAIQLPTLAKGVTATSFTTALSLSRTTVPLTRSTAAPAVQTGPNGNWTLQAGAYLTYEPDTNNEETVVVQPGNMATFYKNHAAGVTVISRGNPGPWKVYDPAQDSSVVPYFAQIN